jgi:hypothetical protein
MIFAAVLAALHASPRSLQDSIGCAAMTSYLKSIRATLFATAVITFAAFIVVDFSMGGSALAGKVENGHFYVADHGKYSQVSERAWMFNRSCEEVMWSVFPLSVIGYVAISFYEKRKAG